MNNMYETFFDKHLCYGLNETSTQEQTRPTYTIDYEDTAKIPFYIDEEYWTDAIIINLYDFRHDLILDTVQFVDDSGHVYLNIDKEFSSSLKRGIYYCGIQAAEVILENNEYKFSERITTIMNQNDCMINVR